MRTEPDSLRSEKDYTGIKAITYVIARLSISAYQEGGRAIPQGGLH